MLIEIDGKRFVYDVCRCSEILIHNLGELGLSIEDIDAIVLSHGHKGHSGALATMSIPKETTVVFGAGLEKPKYKNKQSVKKAVHNECLVEKIHNEIKNSVCVDETPYYLADNVFVFKSKSCSANKETGRFLIKDGDEFIIDEFQEELNICIKSSLGLIVLAGCAHRGINNILDTAIEISRENNVYALMGGTHILDDPSSLEKFYQIVKDYDIDYVAPSHCTGYKAITQIAQQLPSKFWEFNTGKVIKIDN